MTKQLEELFNLEQQEEIQNNLQSLDEIDKQITGITDLSQSDQEMDELANKAVSNFDTLMDLGMNVEPRFSAPIFDAATKLLGHAITAKTSKIEKKLKALDLEIKKRRLEMQEKEAGVNEIEGEAQELDRNSILAMIRNQKQD